MNRWVVCLNQHTIGSSPQATLNGFELVKALDFELIGFPYSLSDI